MTKGEKTPLHLNWKQVVCLTAALVTTACGQTGTPEVTPTPPIASSVAPETTSAPIKLTVQMI